ncbi:MAG: hypothetical protein U0528_14495 [Anaerolineae bacterium]
MTDSAQPRNPYNPYHPTTTAEMFFGREDVYSFLRERLVSGGSNYAVALIGPPGIGKTSTLLQIGYHIEPRYILAYVSMEQVDFHEPGALFVAMADAARSAMEAAGISTLRLPPLPEEATASAEAMWEWFSSAYLEVVLSALRNLRRLLFLFDDTTILLDAIDRGEVSAEIGQTLARIIVEDRRMDIVFAVDAVDEDRLTAFPPLAEPMLHRRLTALDEESSAALTRQPIADLYQLDDEAVQAIYAVTGGHPFLLHLVNGLIWARSATRDHRLTIDIEDVRAVLPEAVQGADEILSPAWHDSNDNERWVLTAITDLTAQSPADAITPEQIRAWLLREKSIGLDETALSAALRRLEYRDILRTAVEGVGAYSFSTSLQYQWLRTRLAAEEAVPESEEAIQRRRPRWLLLPLLVIAVLAGGLAFWIGQGALAQTQTGASTQTAPARTVTLAVNVEETGQAINATATIIALPTSTVSPTLTSTFTATATLSGATSTSVIGATATYTPSASATVTISPTSAIFLTATLPESAVNVTRTATRTATLTVTTTIAATSVISTALPTATFTYTPSATATNTATATATFTASYTPSATATLTATRTATPSPTRTATYTPSATRTFTLTPPPFPTGQVVATQRP